MATRFYFEGDTAPAIRPATAWSRTSATFTVCHAPRDKRLASTAITDTLTYGGLDVANIVCRQWVTETLAFDHAISGTVSMVMPVRDENTTGAMSLAFLLRVVAPDLSTRGILKVQQTGSTVLTNALETRIHDSVALSAVAAKAGDYLVMEVGFHGAGPAADPTLDLQYASTASADFALTSGLTGAGAGWWELSDTLTLGPASGRSLAPTQRAA